MKKNNVIFLDLKGDLMNYLDFIFTKARTSDVTIHSLKTQLNLIIKEAKEGKLRATAFNCEYIWKKLTATVKEANIQRKNDPCYKEIIKAIDTIGQHIAYISSRKGWKYKPMAIYDNYTDEELITAFKIILVNQYSDKSLVPSPYTTHEEYVEDALDKKGYSTMTDEELLIEATKMKNFLQQKRNTEFKATGTDNTFFK